MFSLPITVDEAPLKVGDRVRVKASVTQPKYKWGSVTHRSIGVVTGRNKF